MLTFISNITIKPFMNKWNISYKINYLDYGDLLVNTKTIKDSKYICILINFNELLGNSRYAGITQDENADYFTKQVQEKIEQLITLILNESYAYIIWFNFDYFDDFSYKIVGNYYNLKNYVINKVNSILYRKFKDNNRVSIVDINSLIAKSGIQNSYNIRNLKAWGVPYDKAVFEEIRAIVDRYIISHKFKNPKCLIIDGDNVLWRGILSEDGIGGVDVSFIHNVFQAMVNVLYQQGVVLTLCTQNDLYDIKKLFSERSDFLLRENQFICIKAGWEPKYIKIRQIQEELNIEYDDMVFIDDSLFEINQIATIYPEIKSIVFDEKIINKCVQTFCLKDKVDINSVSKRFASYSKDCLRNSLKKSALSYSEYIKSLKTEINIDLCKQVDYCRVAELSQRTNRKTNGIKLTLEEVLKLAKNETCKIYTLIVRDVFSEYGIVGALILIKNHIKLCCISCRVMNRGIEETMIQTALNLGASSFEYSNTGKNQQFGDLLASSLVEKNKVKNE